jgi:Dolichyl-phosphate-mannose-protein mannosyltransferase
VNVLDGRPAGVPRAYWVLLAAVGLLAGFVLLWRLGTPTWLFDELLYRRQGDAFLRGDFSDGLEHTLLVKYILGASQDLLGDRALGLRGPSAASALLTGVVLLALGWRIGGPWAGLLAFALWALLPRPELMDDVDVGQITIGRYARMEVFVALFSTLGLLAGWLWAETGRWRWALSAGAALGVATACKQPGILVLPAILGAGFVTLERSRRLVAQAAAMAGVACAVVGVTYIHLVFHENLVESVKAMFELADARNRVGQPYVIDGKLHVQAPWWALGWYQWKSLGTAAAVSLAGTIILAPFVLKRSAAVLVVLAVLVPPVALALSVDFALPYWYYAWQPQLVLCGALVVAALVTRGGGARVIGAALAIPLAITALANVRDVARLEPRDFRVAARDLGGRLHSGTVATWDGSSPLPTYLPGLRETGNPIGVTLSAVVVDRTVSGRRPNPALRAFLRAHRKDFVLRRIDFLDIYLPRSPAVARRLAKAPPPPGVGPAASAESRSRSRAAARCLRSGGLAAAFPGALRSYEAPRMSVSLSGGRAVVIFYDSAAEARRNRGPLGRLLAGWRIEALGEAVVAYTGDPPAAQLRRLRSCVDG